VKIVIAPDSYKGSLTSGQVCDIIKQAAERFLPDVWCVCLPVADGGEGMVDALLGTLGGERISVTVRGPFEEPVEAHYALLTDGSAAIEMAAASGLPLVPEGRCDPTRTTTYGTGELIADALNRGCRSIVLGLGGSATNDGGMGAAAALGMRFIDADGRELTPCGGSLSQVAEIDCRGLHPAFTQCEITIACDVSNPLCGPAGAAHVYGPQKGADAVMVEVLDDGLNHLAGLMETQTGKILRTCPGMGAAGGMALPFIAYGNAVLRSGLDIVLDALEFDRHLDGASLVITGEGRTDAQSAMGKVASGVGRRAAAAGVPVIVLSGALEEGCETLYSEGVTALFSCCARVKPLAWQIEHARENLSFAAEQLFRLLAAVGTL
jgi:glycerate kinase